jgi:type I restriction enzyme, R subunit
MSPRNHNPNSEDAMVQQAAIEALSTLGYEHADCYSEGGGEFFVTQRKHMGEVVLEDRLRAAIEKLNPGTAESAVDSTMAEILKDRTSMDQVLANKEVYEMLRDGFPVSFLDSDRIRQDERLRIIDWENADNNDFFVAEELWITGDIYKRRTDLVLYVNGLPLVVVELKASHKNIKKAYEDNITDYKNTIPQLFWYNAFIIVSNGTEAKFGTITSTWEFFHDWKRINDEDETGRVDLETLLLGMCDKQKLLDYVENFCLFQDVSGGTIKIGARNHQYLGVNKTFENLDSAEAKAGQLGVFWHTQGSGKSFSMIFFSEKVLRKVPGNWTFVVITDRLDLDKQIYENFASTGAVTEPDAHVRAASRNNLQQLLTENHRYVFTLIQKFQTTDGSVMEAVSDRNDVIVMTDEAHRTQYDTLALNMRNALPNARYIGFTGTPLMAGEEHTREVFGDYVSTYDFQNAINDGSTVPLYYQNRMPELNFKNEDFNEKMELLIEKENLSPEEERVLARNFATQHHLITNDERLDKVAYDLVDHFHSRGFLGKGMVISIDKITAVKMYDLVQKHWKAKIAELENEFIKMDQGDDPIAYFEMKDKIEWMKETDMAVVVSGEQNEEEKFRKAGVEIRPHRIRMNNQTERIDDKFKDPKDPLRIVFVCAMWITGFDAPSVSTIYLDKPMRNHTLMQTIARANRVFEEKRNGTIVDYVGIFKNLKSALKIYSGGDDDDDDGGGNGGGGPIQNVDELVGELNKVSGQFLSYSLSIGVDLKKIESLEKFDRIEAIDNALEKILENEETKSEFVKIASIFESLYKAVMPDKRANELLWLYRITGVLRDKIRNLGGEIDITNVLDQVKDLVENSIDVSDGRLGTEEKPVLIGDIDFKALEKTFKDGRKKATLEAIKVRLASKIQMMMRKNPLSVDYREKFEKLIAEYNEGILSVDELFEALRTLSDELTKEEVRHEKLGLTEEELTIFDMLNRPGSEHTEKEKEVFKKAARSLMKKLKEEALFIDWKKHQTGRANARVTIEDILQDEVGTVLSEPEQEKLKQEMFQFVYQSYSTANDNVFAC